MPTTQHCSPFEPTLEAGIAALVNEFVAQKAEGVPLPSIAQRREGYEASVALAGESPQSVIFTCVFIVVISVQTNRWRCISMVDAL